jgi:hypothetical protein
MNPILASDWYLAIYMAVCLALMVRPEKATTSTLNPTESAKS